MCVPLGVRGCRAPLHLHTPTLLSFGDMSCLQLQPLWFAQGLPPTPRAQECTLPLTPIIVNSIHPALPMRASPKTLDWNFQERGAFLHWACQADQKCAGSTAWGGSAWEQCWGKDKWNKRLRTLMTSSEPWIQLHLKPSVFVPQSCLALRFHGLMPARLLCPWDFPDKNAGVGCHCLL